MSGSSSRCQWRRFGDSERFLAYHRIIERCSYVEIAAELDCSPNFLFRQFGAQKERVRREPVRSPYRLPQRSARRSAAAYWRARPSAPYPPE